MITFTNNLVINSRLEEVYDFILECENLPKWNYYVTSVTKVEGEGEGSVYFQRRKNDQQYFKISELVPYQKVVLQSVKSADSPIHFHRVFILSRMVDHSTAIKDVFQVDTEYPSLMEFFFKRKIKKAVADNLQKLKELLENRQTVLQDGRLQTI
ncbi:SRPBCC family protein [Fulvivirga sediminis]|uniref:Coenzyme Q-binding protein COQ10 START domain-containing protein n=1 Tax=Fulvivirga sediminis TaxID=2803949 RepID=A0A937FAB8_9BACT|nr:SRPBCC family protein [Fulvivirga sediminis]MBL3657524.1 hypothetical protein [Fulvivirga sediminis]